MSKVWEETQQKTFTKWVNIKLDTKKIPPIKDLSEDLADGVKLIQLLEIISATSLGRYNTKPRMRIQCVGNVNTALEFIKQRSVPLTNIGAEDIVDKRLKLILGLLWMIILRFTIANINQGGKNAKEGLLLWCQRKTMPYKQVHVKDFSESWKDGLAFCALIHCHRPHLLDFDSLDPSNAYENIQLAFNIAEEHLGIPKLLDVEDVCNVATPDERSIMTYVAEYFHVFSSLDHLETAGRRIAKFAEVLRSIWLMKHNYEQRVLALINSVQSLQREWRNTKLTDSYAEAKEKGYEFTNYKNSQKREWVSEKSELDTLFGNIRTKLQTYHLRPYIPPEGLTLNDLDNVWKELLENEAIYHRRINSKIRQIKENLRKAYAHAANDFHKRLDDISAQLANLDGNLDHQLQRVISLSRITESMHASLRNIEALDRECVEANTEENDYTVYSVHDLTFEFGLVEQGLRKKKAFIQNQIVSRNMTNLTPAQLEEFEHAFRHFASEQTNTLSFEGFSTAMTSLGMIYQEVEYEQMFNSIVRGHKEATFEEFIRLMVSITQDNITPEQVHDAFFAIADEKPYVTELDLQMHLVPEDMYYLTHTMPVSHHDANGYNYAAYVSQMFQ